MTKFDLRQKMKMMMENLIMENDDKEESVVNFMVIYMRHLSFLSQKDFWYFQFSFALGFIFVFLFKTLK